MFAPASPGVLQCPSLFCPCSLPTPWERFNDGTAFECAIRVLLRLQMPRELSRQSRPHTQCFTYTSSCSPTCELGAPGRQALSCSPVISPRGVMPLSVSGTCDLLLCNST